MSKKTKAMLEEEVKVLTEQRLKLYQANKTMNNLLNSVYDYLETMHQQFMDVTNSLGGVIEIHKNRGAPTNPFEAEVTDDKISDKGSD